jgi:hypothetical protein
LGWFVLLSGCALYEDIDGIAFQPNDQGQNNITDMASDMTTDMSLNNQNNQPDMTTDMPDVTDMMDMPVVEDMPDIPSVSDMAEMEDMESMADMNDMADMADMNDMSIPVGGICPEPPEMINGTCDPVVQDCPENAFCAVNLQLIMGVPQFELLCFLKDGDETQLEGEPCGQAGTCEPGLTCVAQICRRICWRETGVGCMANEFCREFSGVPGVGYCAPSCP